MGLENRVLNFGGAQEKWRGGSGPPHGKTEEGSEAKLQREDVLAKPPQAKMEEETGAGPTKGLGHNRDPSGGGGEAKRKRACPGLEGRFGGGGAAKNGCMGHGHNPPTEP